MNFKNNALRELPVLSKELPEYSLGEVLYSVIRLTGAKKISDLLLIEDEDFFSAIEEAKKQEKE